MTMLVALRGLPGVGKSSLGQAVARALGWVYLDKDDLKTVILGHTADDGWLAYELLFSQAERHLRQGLSVVCDSPLQFGGLYAAAQRTAHASGARLVVLECVLADEAEHRRRLEARTDLPAWRLARWAELVDYRARLAAYTIEAPCLAVDLSQPLEQATAQALDWLRVQADPHGGWMPRARWQALTRGDGCAMCRELAGPDPENEYSLFVADLPMGRLRLARDQHLPGYCVLVCRRHVREPHELAPHESSAFFADMLRAGQALEHVYEADKINYQVLGNLLPHTHAHIQPRYLGDAFPGQAVLGAPALPVYLATAEYQTKGRQIRAALALS